MIDRKIISKWLASMQPVDSANLILGFGMICFIPWFFYYAWGVISAPYPLEYREGFALMLTDFLLQGNNPFLLSNHPLMNNNYGAFYNLLVLPFAYFWGNTLFVHRSLSFLFLLLSSALIYLTLIKNKVSSLFSLSGAFLVLGCMLYGAQSGARSDTLGQMLFLMAVLIPWHRKFDSFGLSMSGLVGILAFFTKPYYLLSIGIVASYVFLFISKKKGLIFASTSLGTLGVLAFGLNLFLECYFLDVVINNMSNSMLSYQYMWIQLLTFIVAFFPCVVVLLSRALVLIKKVPPVEKPLLVKNRFNGFDLNKPVWQGSLDYFVFFFVCSLLAVVLLLGRHMGAYLTYYFQLLTPGFILIVFRKFDSQQNVLMNSLLFLANLFLIGFWVLYPNQLSPQQQQSWERLYGYIADSHTLLNSPVMVSEMVRLGKLPIDSGQSEYFYTTRPYAGTIWAPDYQEVSTQGKKYLDGISASIQLHEYDRIIITQGLSPFAKPELLDKNYHIVDVLTIAMPHSGQFWITEVWEPNK